jgi:hypothetical protein
MVFANGVCMYLSKIGSVAALSLAGVGLCLLALAPLGWRVGLWQYGFGLYWLMPASGLFGAAAFVLSVLTVARGSAPATRSCHAVRRRRTGRGPRLCAFALLAHA